MIRQARPKDVKQINVLRRQTFEFHLKTRPDYFKNVWDEKYQNEFLKGYIKDDKTFLYIVENDNQIVAYALVEKNEKLETPYSKAKKWCEISDIGVCEEARHQGLGTELMEYIKQDVKKRGFCNIELSVWDFNKSAQKFYKKLGFSARTHKMEIKL